MNPFIPMIMATCGLLAFVLFTQYATSLKAPRRRHRRAH